MELTWRQGSGQGGLWSLNSVRGSRKLKPSPVPSRCWRAIVRTRDETGHTKPRKTQQSSTKRDEPTCIGTCCDLYFSLPSCSRQTHGGSWSMYGYCYGLEDDLLFGEAATKVGAACNSTPDGTEHQCIQRLLKTTFEELPPENQERLREAARQRGY